MRYRYKIVQSGDIFELYCYERVISSGKDFRRKLIKKHDGEDELDFIKEIKESLKESPESIEERAAVRARRTVRRLINANVGRYYDENGYRILPKFFTITFAENVTDLDYAHNEFKNFIKRLNYYLTGKKGNFLKYVAVVEFQERGAVHYHVVFFNLPYVKFEKINEIAEVWGHGFIKLNAIENVDNVGAYVCKYMGKTFLDEKARHDKHRKRYFSSRGLYKPIERAITNEKELDELVARLAPFKVYESEFENEFTGMIQYTQFNVARKKS